MHIYVFWTKHVNVKVGFRVCAECSHAKDDCVRPTGQGDGAVATPNHMRRMTVCGLQDKEMVVLLLKMKASVDNIHREAFQSNEQFGNALKESFEWFINQRPNRPAELVAKFVDAELRAGNKTHNDSELEENLDKALMLFRYIQVPQPLHSYLHTYPHTHTPVYISI